MAYSPENYKSRLSDSFMKWECENCFKTSLHSSDERDYKPVARVQVVGHPCVIEQRDVPEPSQHTHSPRLLACQCKATIEQEVTSLPKAKQGFLKFPKLLLKLT